MILFQDTIYKVDSKGKYRLFSVMAIKDGTSAILRKASGLVDGKQIVSDTDIKAKGKNDKFEQAIQQAQSLLKNKLKLGYSYDMKEIVTPILPMLAQTFTLDTKKIEYPAFVQPKLDGARAFLNNGQFISRKNTPYMFLESLMDVFKKQPPKHLIWDGELYSHGMELNDIISIIRQQVKKPDDKLLKQVSFIIYDVYDPKNPDLGYTERLALIKDHVKNKNSIKTDIVKKPDDVLKFHDVYVDNGYEGIMIRNKDGVYRPGFRSKDLQKFKVFGSEEFKIIDFVEAKGRDSGSIVYVMETPHGSTFTCRPKGTLEERKEAFRNGKYYVNKYVTVTYQRVRNNGIPVFPICSLYPREL